MSTQTPRQDAQPWPRPNPALKDLSVLVGEWDLELSNSAFLASPSDTVKAYVSFDWTQDAAFLVMRQGGLPPSPPSAIWLMGRDESGAEYDVLYYDARGVSRHYSMSFQGSTWKMWRNSPGFCQRYAATLSDDGNSIKASWEKSEDAKQWEHDFDLAYTRRR